MTDAGFTLSDAVTVSTRTRSSRQAAAASCLQLRPGRPVSLPMIRWISPAAGR